MDNSTQKPESKLLAMVDNVVTHNGAYKRVFQSTKHSDEEKRAYGILNADIRHLQESAEHFRKSGER